MPINKFINTIVYFWEMDDSAPTLPALSQKRKKKVQYSNVCTVVLIPTRKEFKEAGLDLWYRRGEYDCGENDHSLF